MMLKTITATINLNFKLSGVDIQLSHNLPD